MIFYRLVEVEDPAFACTKQVFVLHVDDAGSFTTTKDLISDKDRFTSLSTTEGIKVAVLPDTTTPLIVLSGDSEDATNVSSIYNQIVVILKDETKSDEIKTAVLKKVAGALAPQLGDKNANALVAAIKLQYQWESEAELIKPFKVDAIDTDTDLRVHTMHVLEEANSKFVNAITCISPQENYTRFQENCEDMFFVEIPNRLELIEAEKAYPCIPKMDEVCKPYTGYEGATKPSYKTRSFSSFVLSIIEGDKKNNGHPVYENEKVFEQALTEWVQFNMREDFGTSDGTVIDNVSEGFLLDLASAMYVWHWRHCKSVPTSINYDISEEDEDSLYNFEVEPGVQPSNVNAVVILREYLKMVSADLGYKALISAVIQISRWGTRKPTAITFEDFPEEFVLGIGLVRSKQADLSKYHEVLSDGCKYSIAGFIYDDAKINDKSIGAEEWNFPVGIALENKMASDAGDEITLTTYVPMVDLLSTVKAGSMTVAGLNFENGEWNFPANVEHYAYVGELISDYEQNKEQILQFPFYRSSEIIDLAVELQISNSRIPVNLLTVMHNRVADPSLVNHMTAAAFSSVNQLGDLIANGKVQSKLTALELGIVRQLLPLYKKMAAAAKPLNALDIFKAWEAAMEEFSGVTAWYGTNAKVASEGDITPVNSFNNAKVEKTHTVAEQPNTQTVIHETETVESEHKSEKEEDQVRLAGELLKPQPVTQQSMMTHHHHTATTENESKLDALLAQCSNESSQEPQRNTGMTGATTQYSEPAMSSWIKDVPTNAELCKVTHGDQLLCYCYKETIANPNRPGKTNSRYTLVTNTEGREVTEVTIKSERIIATILHNLYLEQIRGSKAKQIFFENGDALNAIKMHFQKLSV